MGIIRLSFTEDALKQQCSGNYWENSTHLANSQDSYTHASNTQEKETNVP